MECSIEGCDREVLARGWCRAHYKRWSKHGDPLAGGTPRLPFWQRVDKQAGGCWVWTGARDRAGYGVTNPTDQFSKYAHRRAYQEIVGPVPEGLELDHLCRNPSCCNPAHLEPVTHAENVRRGWGRERTHCPHGHEYTAENTYEHGGRKFCRACNRAASRRYNAEVRPFI